MWYDQNHKASTCPFRPSDAVRGLQVGFSAYRTACAANLPESRTIFAVHAVLWRSKFEWLNEAYCSSCPNGIPRVFNTGVYTQVQNNSAPIAYFRYQYVNASRDRPIFPDGWICAKARP